MDLVVVFPVEFSKVNWKSIEVRWVEGKVAVE
jgi:hypothetical protein